jgi:hypothetical protein
VLVRRRRSKRLCAIDQEHYSIKAKPVKLLFAEFHAEDQREHRVSFATSCAR